MERWLSVTIKTLLTVVAVLSVASQALMPLLASDVAVQAPEFAHLQAPYVAAFIVFVLAIEIVIISIWRLLRFVQAGSIFTPAAFAWVNVIIYAGAAATVIVAAVFAHATFGAGIGPITVPAMLAGTVAGVGLFTLLMVVMRALLRSAVTMHDELAEVI